MRQRHGGVSCIMALVIAAASAAVAQQPPSPADLPAEYRGTDIDRALKAQAWPEAERLLVAAIERHPDSRALLEVLGSVFLIQRKPLNAAIAIKKAEALGPLDDRTRFDLVLAYIALERRDWARPELERLAASDPQNATYAYWLGRLHYDAGQYGAAARRFNQVIAREPDSIRAHDNLGLCYEALNQPDDAIHHFRIAVERTRSAATNPKSPWPALNLATLLGQRGDLAEAESLLREALGYDGTLAQAHYQLGIVLEQRGRLDAAVADLRAAADHDAYYPEPHYALARIQQRLGRTADADAALATFQRLKDARRESGGR